MDAFSSSSPFYTKPEQMPIQALTVQRKGESQVYYIPLHKVNCWDDLITSIHNLFTFSFSSPPAIVTFEGDLVSERNYLDFMQPDRHLFLNFPPTFQASDNSLRRMSDHFSPNMMPQNASYSIAFMKKDPTGGATSIQSFSPSSPSPAFRNRLEATEARERRLEEERHIAHAKAQEELARFSQYTSTGSLVSNERYALSAIGIPLSFSLSPNSSGTAQVARKLSQSSETPSTVSHSSASHLSDDHSYQQTSHSLTPATEYSSDADSNRNFARSPNVLYPAADPWSSVSGKKEQQEYGLQFTTTPSAAEPSDILDPTLSGLLSRQQMYSAPILPSYSTDDMQLTPGFPVSNSIQQSLTHSESSLSVGEQVEHEICSVRSQSPLDVQWDHIETPESKSVLLCPHITFHCVRPIELKIRITPTVTVVPPSHSLDHDRMYATAVGEHVKLDMSIEGNGKITRIVSHPEGTKTPEKISLLKKSQGKGAGGKWYISRMETQESGGWGSAEVGDLGGDGADGKKRNPGVMVDWSFKGEQNEKRSFAVAYDKVSEFLDLFMDTCGYPKRERQTMINFWARRLPQEASETEFLLIKLLPVKDLVTMLPIQTEPPPDRTVRFFVILRRATREIVKKEGLRVRGEMARVVYEVLGSKPPPVVPATNGRKRGRTKGKQSKGPYGDSNATMRDVERPSGLNPNPQAPLEGGSGLTIFEYGGVLMSNHADEDMLQGDSATAIAKSPDIVKIEQHPLQTARYDGSPMSVSPMHVDHGNSETTYFDHSAEFQGHQPYVPHHSTANYPGLLTPQPEVAMSNFAAQPADEVISNLYYGSQPYYDPYTLYAHEDMEYHDPNQQIFTVVGASGVYETRPPVIHNVAPQWEWPGPGF